MPLRRQRLMMLQRALNNTTRRLSVQAPIIATLGLLNITVAIGFRLEHHKDLGLGLHKLGLVQNTSASRKVLKVRSDQHQVIMGGSAAPSLADTATLAAPDNVPLTTTLAMAQGGAHAAEGDPGHMVWNQPPHCAGDKVGELGYHEEEDRDRTVQPP